MAIAKSPSKLTLPPINPGFITVVDYLIDKFPQVDSQIWRQRAIDGKLHWHDGSAITSESLYRPQQRVYYYREVDSEPVIPFNETILFEDAEILVAYKPPFLPVTPGGIYVNECLQNRLRLKTGMENLQAVHRIDRATTGLVIFSVNPDTCHLYHQLFASRQINKTYQAIARIDMGSDTGSDTKSDEPLSGQQWEVVNRLQSADPRFLMRVADGAANSHSRIRCVDRFEDKALFELEPVTGKTHQLRVHMQTLGWPILHDRYYPALQPKSADNFAQPLQLLAQQLRFIDPVTSQPRTFHCGYAMNLATGTFERV
ncbi:pseudouridine synthase [Neptunomonas antarctica]|uniref:tRNA pseudouridine32 synthase / 23S rRNA pseudouridine746 synthase n=2 Tax=Neptunomonas antarctica TaxID=619304 RepID=A0A1N7IZH9_9GAMM|nr:pseudouridine synthase [Neptunomonas antarctica]SIS42518.1 tRNA pseudouridine32 synthase / 23S rRNA pseudouridine746 synthase [Neptunomonas antarctica]